MNGLNQTKKWLANNKIKALLFVVVVYFLIPEPKFETTYAHVLEAKDGTLLGAQIAADEQWRFPPLDSIPDRFATALITFEDQRFYRHPGIDPIGVGRAIRDNMKARRVVSGASTISMQVARLSRQHPSRHVIEKLFESLCALKLESKRSKTYILSLYASHAPFGGNVVGLEAASWRYFGKQPTGLTWAEAATLAVLPNSPGLVYPGRNRTALRQKRDRLLAKLRTQGHIDEDTYTLSLLEPLPEAPNPLPREAPHLLAHMIKEFPARDRIRSSIDNMAQRAVNRAVSQYMEPMRNSLIHNAAVLVANYRTGEIVAYVGNTPNLEQAHQPDVDVIQAARSTGSVLKPILYAAMLDEGELLPTGIVPDIPFQVSGYQPKNFSEDYVGAIPANQALIQSLNIPFVQLLQQYNVSKFYNKLKLLGMNSIHQPPHHYGLTLILGGAEATLMEMVSAYAYLARMTTEYGQLDSRYVSDIQPLTAIPSMENISNDGQLVTTAPVLGAGAFHVTMQTMKQVARPDEMGHWMRFEGQKPIAWKTGTSIGFRDAWSIGISDELIVGVWVGNADGEGRPSLIGVRAAAPLMFTTFQALAQWDSPSHAALIPYDDLQRIAVCATSGWLPSEICPRDTVWASLKAHRNKVCQYHERILVNAAGLRVHQGCEAMNHSTAKVVFTLPPVEAYYYRRNHFDYQGMPAWQPGCDMQDQHAQLDIVYPDHNQQMIIPRDFDGQREQLVLRATHQRPEATLYWHLDDHFIVATQDIHQLTTDISPGPHTLVVTDGWGERVSRQFIVNY